jgi:histone-lysine N-methyltransferase SETD2
MRENEEAQRLEDEAAHAKESGKRVNGVAVGGLVNGSASGPEVEMDMDMDTDQPPQQARKQQQQQAVLSH